MGALQTPLGEVGEIKECKVESCGSDLVLPQLGLGVLELPRCLLEHHFMQVGSVNGVAKKSIEKVDGPLGDRLSIDVVVLVTEDLLRNLVKVDVLCSSG